MVICSITDLREVMGYKLLEITSLVVIHRRVRRGHYNHRGRGIIGDCEVGGRLSNAGVKQKMVLMDDC